jgi:hypothetical protein
MAKIEITIKDDDGNITGTKEYELELGRETLDDIEEAVEGLKNEFLPELEHELLNNVQTKVKKNVRKKIN